MSQQRVETILGELNHSVERLDDDAAEFNIAIRIRDRVIHFLGPKDDLTGVLALSGLRLSDEHWKVLLELSEEDRKRFYLRVTELLLIRGVRYSFSQEREDDTSSRMLQVSCRIDIDNLNRSSVNSAINEVIDGGALFTLVAQKLTL